MNEIIKKEKKKVDLIASLFRSVKWMDCAYGTDDPNERERILRSIRDLETDLIELRELYE
jgi:hypothetical protein